jgi:hypothetical protein
MISCWKWIIRYSFARDFVAWVFIARYFVGDIMSRDIFVAILCHGILISINILTVRASDLVKEHFNNLRIFLLMMILFQPRNKMRMLISTLPLYGTIVLHMVHVFSIDDNISGSVKFIELTSFTAEYLFLISFIITLVKIYTNTL